MLPLLRAATAAARSGLLLPASGATARSKPLLPAAGAAARSGLLLPAAASGCGGGFCWRICVVVGCLYLLLLVADLLLVVAVSRLFSFVFCDWLVCVGLSVTCDQVFVIVYLVCDQMFGDL